MFFWICIALILFIIDLLTSGALVIGFTVSAIITSVLSVVLPFWVEVICFVIMSGLLTVYLVPKITKVPNLKSYGDNLEGVVIKASCDMVIDEVYQEKVKGVFWNIKSIETINKNDNIKIIKVDKENNCLIVKGE